MGGRKEERNPKGLVESEGGTLSVFRQRRGPNWRGEGTDGRRETDGRRTGGGGGEGGRGEGGGRCGVKGGGLVRGKEEKGGRKRTSKNTCSLIAMKCESLTERRYNCTLSNTALQLRDTLQIFTLWPVPSLTTSRAIGGHLYVSRGVIHFPKMETKREKLMHNLLDRCYGRGSAGRHLRRRSGERVELVDHVQREVGASGQQQERCDGTQTRTPSSNTYEDCEERAGVQDGHLLSEGRTDDGVREERGERAAFDSPRSKIKRNSILRSN